MLDVIKSLDRLTWNTQHHFAHIEAQHDFIRAWAIQFELGYTMCELSKWHCSWMASTTTC